VPRIALAHRTLAALLVAALAGCTDASSRLSVEESFACARERFKDHSGTFALSGNAIVYSYDSNNGSAKVIVTFDANRKSHNTFFESTPYGSHEEDGGRSGDQGVRGIWTSRSERRRGCGGSEALTLHTGGSLELVSASLTIQDLGVSFRVQMALGSPRASGEN
jgi:hypothetical protein